MDEMIYLIWLSILDLRPIEKIKLLEIFKTAHNIFKLDEKKLRKINRKRIILTQSFIDNIDSFINLYNRNLFDHYQFRTIIIFNIHK